MTAPYNANEVFDRHKPDLEQLTVSLQTDAVTAYSLLASLYHAATSDRRMARQVLVDDNPLGRLTADLERQLAITPEMQRLVQDVHEGAALTAYRNSGRNPARPSRPQRPH